MFQNDIIKQLLAIEDVDTLFLLKEILSQKTEDGHYKLSEFEKRIVAESQTDYNKGNIREHDSVFNRNKKWLEE